MTGYSLVLKRLRSSELSCQDCISEPQNQAKTAELLLTVLLGQNYDVPTGLLGSYHLDLQLA